MLQKEQINQMFEGRWRMKGSSTLPMMRKILGGKLTMQELSVEISSLCHDFFEAGILLASQETESDEPSVLMEDFEIWWKLYQKKRGKAKSMKKWEKMSRKERQACIAATPAYVASTPDATYRKDPLTYLNGKCWNDEIIYRNNAANQPTIEQQRRDKLASILTD